jgi:hypothetical protein
MARRPHRRRSYAQDAAFLGWRRQGSPAALSAFGLILLLGGCGTPPEDSDETAGTPDAAVTSAPTGDDASTPGDAAIELTRTADPEPGLSPAASPALWLTTQLAGDWRATTVRYPAEDAPQLSRHSYRLLPLEPGELIVEATRVGSSAAPVVAWVRYQDLPATPGIAAVEYRQGPVGDLDAVEPARMSRGVLQGRTLIMDEAANGVERRRRIALLGGELMLTLVEPGDAAPIMELAVRGDGDVPDPGPLTPVSDARSLRDALVGTWSGQRYHALTGERVSYDRRVEQIDDETLLVRERVQSEGAAAVDVTRVRRLAVTDTLDGGLRLSQGVWAGSPADVLPLGEADLVWRGEAAHNVVVWSERLNRSQETARLETHWLLIGEDLVLRMTQEPNGSWWYAVEQRQAS